jgi:uncharacterized protein (DUF4415 family)
MTKRKRKAPTISKAEEARIQAGIAADPDNPEWTQEDFRRAKPFAEMFPTLAKSLRGRGPQKKPTKVAVSLRLTRAVVERFKAGRTGLADPDRQGTEEGGGGLVIPAKAEIDSSAIMHRPHPEVLARLGEPRRMAAGAEFVAILRGPRETRGHLRMRVKDYEGWYK